MTTPYDEVFPLWRIRRKGKFDPPQYYNADRAEFVTAGEGHYSIFTNQMKMRRFQNDAERNWESFGYRIPLEDD